MSGRYFNNLDHDKLIYFQMPKVLIYGEKYKSLSNDAKLLYMLCLDLTKLSMENHGKTDKNGNVQNWKDEKGFYIKLSLEKIQKLMNCGKTKAVKLKKELEKHNLLEQKRQGLNKSNLLYVLQLEYTEEDIIKVNNLHEEFLEDDEQGLNENNKNKNAKTVGEQRKFKKRTSGSSENEPQEVRKTNTIKNKDIENKLIDNKNQYQYLSEYLYKSKLPMRLKKYFEKQISVLVKYPSFDLSKIEYIWNTYVEFIDPEADQQDFERLNEVEFCYTIEKLFESVIQNKKPIRNMEGLVKTWIMNALSFKRERVFNSTERFEYDIANVKQDHWNTTDVNTLDFSKKRFF